MRAAALSSAVAAAGAARVRVPGSGGQTVDAACVARVANRAVHDADAARATGCAAGSLSAPRLQIYASDVHLHSDTPLKSFTADWTVPANPAKDGLFDGQTVYFWPGFKSQQPEMGLPVLQPVLQWGEYGKYWELQSWFVDGNDRDNYPVVTAPAIRVSAGDKITSFMNLSADGTTWTVSGTDVTTGEDSTLSIKYKKAGDCDYDYAMLVNENIDVNAKCELMPATTNVTFTRVTVDGKVPTWTPRANCAGDKSCDCGNKAEVAPNGDVVLSWDPTKTA